MKSSHTLRYDSEIASRNQRRGVLLLVVLSMLTLFMMLGTAYLVVSTRSRETARAFAKLAMQSEDNRIPNAPLLDAAFLRIVRGGGSLKNSPNMPSVVTLSGTLESLLQDKYGSSATGTATNVTAIANAPLLQITGITVATDSTAVPWTPTTPGPAGLEAITDFPGRVITLLGAGREPTSHRIVRSTGTGSNLSLVVDLPSTTRLFRIPSGSTPFVINGPEFQPHTVASGTTTNEDWDAFDDLNRFLTRLAPTDTANAAASESVSSSAVMKVGLLGSTDSNTIISNGILSTGTAGSSSGFSYGADNDGDGVVDGLFVDLGLPVSYRSNGDQIRFDVSALVVDLDSRYNVNAHGSLSSYVYSGTATPHGGWASGTAQRLTWLGTTSTTSTLNVPPLIGLPVGSGYGPAEVNPAWMFPASSYSVGSRAQDGENTAMYGLFALSGVAGNSFTGTRIAGAGSRFSVGGQTPRLSNIEGRYGEGSTNDYATTSSVSTLLSDTATQLTSGFTLALPGTPLVDDTISQFTDQGVNTTTGTTPNLRKGGIPSTWWNGSRDYNWAQWGTVAVSGSYGPASTRAAYNSPPDLHGRMIMTTSTTSASDVVPRLVYAKPAWGATEATDDPYEVRLDARAPRNALILSTGTAVDNIFSAAELEPVLRPYDRDSFQLPQRLNALLGGVAEEARLRVTTDSWDTTAITGTAAANVRQWLRTAISGGASPVFGSSPVTGLIGGEISRGERFNLNRPFTAEKPAAYDATHPYYRQRQAYFKDLYTLMVAVSGTASPPSPATRQKYAQWAANVVEFRDDDSTMTPFEYDTNPSNGWNVDGDVSSSSGDTERAVVWGAERPEVIIAATSAWENSTTGEMFILLHRPWNAIALSRDSGVSQAVPAEPIDVELDVLQGDTGKDLLNLSRKSANKPFDPTDTATYPVWRLRIVDSGTTNYVRFDISTSGTTNELVASGLTTQYRMAADSWQTVMGSNTPGFTVSGTTNPTFSAFAPPGPRPAAFVTTSSTAQVYLERLTDPRAVVTDSMWTASPSSDDPAANGQVPMYRIVDQLSMQVVNREPPAPMSPPANNYYSVTYRSGSGLWGCPTTTAAATPNATALDSSHFARGGGNYAPSWLPWNNRPFVSSAELFLVPGSDPNATGNGKDALGLLQQYTQPTSVATLPALSGTFIPDGLLDVVHVPTRFAAIHTTVPLVGLAALSTNCGIDSDILSVNQLSSFREPGRVNLNTVAADDVWNAVVAGPLQTSGSASPVRTRSAANLTAQPLKSRQDLLSLSATTGGGAVPPPIKDTFSLLTQLQPMNPAHNIYTATRLANTATTRSNVFGIWITVRESVADDPDSIKLHRAFYIFDRSIPVAYEPGKDHNVWDAVLLRRIIQ